MKAKPRYKPKESAPVEGVYVAVDRSGEVLGMAVRRKKGQELPELLADDSEPVGYIRIGEFEAILP